MTKTEAVARVAMLIEGHGDGREAGVFREGDIEACKMVHAVLLAMPGVRAEVERLQNAARSRGRAILFRGFEHELPEEEQIALYGHVVTPFTGAGLKL